MSARILDVLFDRFRRAGDIEALGEVFDRTAPELVRIATSLVRDPHEADDLVQQTFLTAIERAARYDATRRLEPWLLGILVHHARELRERNARQLDPARFEHRAPALPDESLLSGEVAEAFERALGELPRTDREVLESYLRAGKGAVEIARESGLAPGAVRMRIHRGLDRLRRALPAGLALGGAAGAVHGQGAVRARILLAGRDALQNGPLVGATGAAGIVGGLLMSKKIAAAVVLLALAAGYSFLVHGRNVAAPEERELAQVEPPPRAQVAPEAVLSPSALPEALLASSGAARTSAALSEASDADRAGLRGRVVESDGAPVPALAVVLLELREGELRGASLDASPAPRLVAASATTDAEGVFVLECESVAGLRALGLDLGGPRGALRELEVDLAPGATADLGDVALPPCGALAGRVVDAEGAGVAGARVRVGALPPALLALGFDGLVAGGAVAEVKAGEAVDFVFELPPWLSAVEARLPLATTTSGADGSFVLEHAPAGSLTALVDAPGFARLSSAPFRLDAGQRLELAPLALGPGETIRARVRDADGRAVAGAEVRAGTQAMPGGPALFGATSPSDADGRCAFEHVAPGRDVVVLARHDALAPWRLAVEAGGEYVVALEAPRELVLEVVDAAGTPVAAPELFVRRASPMDWFGALAPAWRAVRPRDAGPGRFALGPLAEGQYEVAARAAGLAQASASATLGSEPTPMLRLTLQPPRRVSVSVREASTGQPLAGVEVRVEKAGTVRPLIVCSARSDADGRAELVLPAGGAEPLDLRVEHPRFAPLTLPLGDSASYELALSAGGRLVVRLADAEPADACALRLEYCGPRARPEARFPRTVRLHTEGEQVFERLQPGKWSWDLFDSVGGRDPLAALESPVIGRAHGEFELADGQTLALALDSRGEVAAPAAGEASLAGLVRIEGQPAGELFVSLCPVEHHDDSETLYAQGQGGRFRFDGVEPGEYHLVVQDARTLGDSPVTLLQETLRLEAGEQHELERDLERLACRLVVLGADGQPAAGALLALTPLDELSQGVGAEARTGRDGSARVELAHRGRYAVFASHAELGVARGELAVGADGADDCILTLSPGVECAGTLRLPSDAPQDTERCFLMLAAPADPEFQLSRRVKVAGGRGSFRFTGLAPGKYVADLYVESTSLRASFELPEWGDGALELSFETRAQ